MAEQAEQRRETVPGVVMVVHHQHPVSHEIALATLGGDRSGGGAISCRPLIGERWEPDDELGALPRTVTVRDHGATVELHDPFYERQSDAEALARAIAGRLDLYEHVKNPREHLLRN